MKKIFLVILALFLMAGCSIPTNLAKNWKNYSHAFIFYLAGDNDMGDYFVGDLNAMEYALFEHPREDIKIIAILDTSGEGAKIFEVLPDEDLFFINSKVISDLGEINMGDPQILENFIVSAIEGYPARHYYLVFSDHGKGVEGCCWDDSSDDHLAIAELNSALRNAKEKTKVTFEIIGFDCCRMATIEVAYAIKDFGRIMVASQDVEWAPGWFLESIFSEVLLNPKLQPEDLAKTIVRKHSINNRELNRPFTLSAIDLGKIPSLVPPLCKISQYLTDTLNKEKDTNFTDKNLTLTELNKLRDNMRRWSYEEVDIYDLASQLEKINLPLETNQAISELKNALTSAIIIKATSKNMPLANGLSIRLFNPEGIPTDLGFPQEWKIFLDTWQDCDSFYQKLNPPNPNIPSVPTNTVPSTIADGIPYQHTKAGG